MSTTTQSHTVTHTRICHKVPLFLFGVLLDQRMHGWLLSGFRWDKIKRDTKQGLRIHYKISIEWTRCKYPFDMVYPIANPWLRLQLFWFYLTSKRVP